MIATPRITELRKLVDEARSEGKRVGFVPTMGALHAGHRSLVERARTDCDYVIVSIFVNPTQFGPNEDLDAYPRTFAADLDMCKDAGADLVFHPDAAEMYPTPSSTTVLLSDLTETMEGAHRTDHFGGVALVVAKLFNIVGPCTAFFGEKDAQQLRVVRRMARDLSMPVEVVGCPTVREGDGLAMSSRNVYLSAEERKKALALSRALREVEKAIGEGERDVAALEAKGRAELSGVDAVDYFDVVDPDSLEHQTEVTGTVLVCGAVRVGKTRLIDNITVTTTSDAQGAALSGSGMGDMG